MDSNTAAKSGPRRKGREETKRDVMAIRREKEAVQESSQEANHGQEDDEDEGLEQQPCNHIGGVFHVGQISDNQCCLAFV